MGADTTGTAAAPIFFATPEDLRAWFQRHHAEQPELHAGFHKRGTGRPSITWPESVDEALCVGWIDGIRRSLGAESYTIRFTPRRATSIWSAVNIGRIAVLTAEGRMQPAGLKAFEARHEKRSRVYRYEQADHREKLAALSPELPEPYVAQFQGNAAAWAFFQRQPPSTRKRWIIWLLGTKVEATRLRRLEKLLAACADGKRL